MMGWEKLSRLFFLSSKGGIRRRLLIWGLALLGASLIINTLAGSTYTRSQIKQAAREQQTEMASLVARSFQSFINRKLERLSDIAATMGLYEMGSEQQRLLALLLLKNDRAFTEIAILDSRGMEVLKLAERRVYLPSELSDQRGSRKFETAMEGKNYVSPVYFSDMAEPYVTMAVPLRVSPLEVIGAVVAEAYLKFLWEAIAEVEFGRAGYAYLVDGQGNLIAHRDPSLVLKRTNLSRVHKVQEFLRNPTAVDATPASEGQGIAGKPVLGTYVPVPELGWAVILEEPVDLALAELRKVERYAILLLGVGLMVGAVVIVWVSSRITGPIRELHRGAEVIGKGDLDHRVNIKTGDEIEQLAQEFNKMAGELKTSHATLEQRVEQRTRELSILYSLVATVNQSLDLNTVLKEASKKVLEVLPFDACRIYLLDHERGELQLKEHVGIGEEVSQTPIYKIGVGINGRVVESGEAFLFEDVETDPRYAQLAYSGVAKRAGFHALASFPIKVKGKIEGTIDLLAAAPRRFTPEITELISSVANQIGVAIDNARLFSEVKQKTVELEEINADLKKREETQKLLKELSQDITTLSLDSLLRKLTEQIREFFKVDVCDVRVSDKGVWRPIGISGIEPKRLQSSSTGTARGRSRWIIENRRPLAITDITEAQDIPGGETTRLLGVRGYLAVPLISRSGEVIGVLRALTYQPREFSEEEVDLVQQLANGAAIAVDNARLFEETTSKAKELSALYSISTEISQSLNIDFVLRSVMRRVLEIFDFDAGRIYFHGENEEELRLIAQEGFPESIPLPLRYKADEGIMGKILESGEPLFVADMQTDPEFQRAARTRVMLQAGYRGQFWIPVRVKGKTVGIVSCVSKKSHHFSAREVQLMRSIVGHLGVVIDNARLFEEAVKRTQELSALYDVVASVNQSLEPDVVLREVIRKVLEVAQFDAARVYLLDPGGKQLRLRASQGISPEYASQTETFRVGDGVNGIVVATGKPAIFEDVQTDPQYSELAAGKQAQKAGFRCYISLPLKSKTKSIGTINFLSYQARNISPQEVALLSSMANQISIAIEKASLFEETVKRTQQLSALYDVTATANQSLEIDPVLQEVIKKMTEIFYFDTMRVYLFNAQMDELHVRAAFPSNRDDLSRVRVFRRGEGIVGKVAETGEAMIFEDVRSDAQYKKFSQSKNTQQTGYRFFAAFPIKAKLKPVGTIICNSKTVRQLTTDEIRLITSMLDQVGAAVENARLFEETVARSKELSALYSLSTEIGQSLDLDFVLRRVMHKLLEIFGFDAGRIYVIGKNEKELRLMAQEGFPESISLPLSYKAGEGFVGRVFESGQPLFVEDIQTDREFQRLAHSRITLEAGYRGQFWIPVQAKGKTVGVVSCVSKKSYRFSGSDFQLLHSIVSRLGVAVENATLFSELREKSVELQKANVELQEANRIKEDFLAATSHELRTPLNVIIGNADLIRDGVFGEVNDKQKDALQKIFHYADNLLQLINNVLAVTRAGAGKLSLNLSTFQVEEIIRNVQNYVEQLNRNGRLQFLWKVEPSLASITTDALKLEEILMNLIGNAYKFTPKGKIEIRVRDLREKDRVEFSVADTGIGIAKNEVDKIFEQFYQLGDPHTGDHTGMGLGLNIVKEYLEMMRGDIQVESKLGVGSTFTFTLPYSIEVRFQSQVAKEEDRKQNPES